MKEITPELLNLVMKSAKKMIPDHVITKRLEGRPSFGRDRMVMPDIFYHDVRFLKFKEGIFGLLKKSKPGNYVVEGVESTVGGDSSILGTDMQIESLPPEYIERSELIKYNAMENTRLIDVMNLFLESAHDDGQGVALDLNTSFGGMIGNIRDNILFAKMLQLSFSDAKIFQDLSHDITNTISNARMRQLIEQSYVELSSPIYIKIMNRTQAKKSSKKISFIDPVTNSTVTQLDSFLNTPNEKYFDLGVPRSFGYRLDAFRKVYGDAGLISDFLAVVHAARNRTIFPSSQLNKSLTTCLTPLMNTFKDALFPLATQMNTKFEPFRGTPFFHDFYEMAETQGYARADIKYRPLVTNWYKESFCLFYDFSGYDHHVPSNIQLDICLNLYNKLLPDGMKIAHSNRVIPVIANNRYRRSARPFCDLDPYNSDTKYPLEFNLQNFSGEADVTLTNYIISLTFLCVVLGTDIRTILSKSFRQLVCCYMHSDDCGLVIHDPGMLKIIFTNLGIKVRLDLLDLSKIHIKFHPVLKQFATSEKLDTAIVITKKIMGQDVKLSDKPEILKNLFYYNDDGMIDACHLSQNFLSGMVCPEGDYRFRSSGAEKKFPNLRPYYRQQVYADNPDVVSLLPEIDKLSFSIFGKAWLDNFPLTKDEMLILQSVDLPSEKLTRSLQLMILENKPEYLTYKLKPEQFDADLLDKYFLSVDGAGRDRMLHEKINRDNYIKDIRNYLEITYKVKDVVRR